MKTKEELNALKEEVMTLNKKLAELSEDELMQVSGGWIGPCIIYIVRIGDTIFSIAQKYKAPERIIMELNGIVNPDKIYEGQSLLIPVMS